VSEYDWYEDVGSKVVGAVLAAALWLVLMFWAYDCKTSGCEDECRREHIATPEQCKFMCEKAATRGW
jgi:hypothetical protein